MPATRASAAILHAVAGHGAYDHRNVADDSDDVLYAAWRAGDFAAAEQLVLRHVRRLLELVSKHVHPDAVDDLTIEALRVCLHEAPTQGGEPFQDRLDAAASDVCVRYIEDGGLGPPWSESHAALAPVVTLEEQRCFAMLVHEGRAPQEVAAALGLSRDGLAELIGRAGRRGRRGPVPRPYWMRHPSRGPDDPDDPDDPDPIVA